MKRWEYADKNAAWQAADRRRRYRIGKLPDKRNQSTQSA